MSFISWSGLERTEVPCQDPTAWSMENLRYTEGRDLLPREMPDESDRKVAKADKVRRRWLGRWLLKLVGWFVALSIVVILIVSVVALIAWQNLTGLANAVVARFAEPYRVELGKVDVSKRGEVHMEAVRILPPKGFGEDDSVPWVNLEGIDLTYDLEELRQKRKFRTITLRSPEIHIDDASLEVLGGKAPATDSGAEDIAAPMPDLAFLGQVADRIEVTGGKLKVDTSKGPKLAANWDLSIPAINFGDEEWINREPLSLRLTTLRVGEDAVLGTIDSIEIKGRVRSDLGGVEIAEFAVDTPKLKLSPEWMPQIEATDVKVAPVRASEPQKSPASVAPPALANQEPFELWVDAFRFSDAEISLSGFDGQDGRLLLPTTSFATSIDWRDLQLAGGEITSGKPLVFAVEDIVLDGWAVAKKDNVPTASIKRLAVGFDPAAFMSDLRLESIEITQPQFFLSPGSMARFRTTEESSEEKAVTPTTSAPTESGESAEDRVFSIGSFSVVDGNLKAQDWQWEERDIPSASFDWELTLTDLSSDMLEENAAVIASGERPQHLLLKNLRVGETEGDGLPTTELEEGLVAIDRLETRFQWEKLLRDHRVDAFHVERPRLDLTDQRLPAWVGDFQAPVSSDGPGSESPTAPPVTTTPASEVKPFVVDELRVEDGIIRLDSRALGGQLPKLQGKFSIANGEKSDPEAETHPYRFHFGQLRVRSQKEQAMNGMFAAELESEPVADAPPEPAPEPLGGLFPQDADPAAAPGAADEKTEFARRGAERQKDIAFVRDLTIDFTAEGVQRDRRVERIEVKGGEFQLGKGVQEIVDGAAVDDATTEGGDKSADPAKALKPEPEKEGVAPKKADATDSDGAWKVGEFVVTESQVRFESLIPQIEGLEFAIETKLTDIPLSQEGLLGQDQTQKVELSGIEIRDPYDSFITVAFLPTIFVEFSFAGLVNQRIDQVDLLNPSIYVGQGLFWWIDYQRNYRKQNEGAGFEVGGAPVAEAVDPVAAPDAEADPDWEIRHIDAHFGKIIIAPTGRPIGIVPFPFNASTNMENGEIALKLQIPLEQQYVYQFPDFQLDMYGLKGEIAFNVPVQQVDNNLVQTFSLQRAVWKQYEADGLYLSLTFDTNGVYGKFGGDAYQGYVEGEFNFYLDDVGRWDAWLSGSNLNMGPITEIVAPESFIMDGKIDAKLVSEGRGLVFGETWGEIRTLSPGRIDFSKMNDVINSLPEDWNQLKRSATELSLGTLKEFEYEAGTGDLYFVNRDGWLRLDLEGESGSRVFEMYAHDWRGPEGEKEADLDLTEVIADEKPEEHSLEEGEESIEKPVSTNLQRNRLRRRAGPSGKGLP